MEFDPTRYGAEVARILSLDQDGQRWMPLVCGRCSSQEARTALREAEARRLFPQSRHAEAALAGLWLYFSCFEEAHTLADSIRSSEGALWHAILHRQEPDSGNAAYWFRRAGFHATFPDLGRKASEILRRLPDAEFRVGKWDPYAFIAFCDRARDQPGTVQERAAIEIQRAEWQILFDYCARSKDGSDA